MLETLSILFAYYILITAFVMAIVSVVFHKQINANKLNLQETSILSLMWPIIVPMFMLVSILKPDDEF